MNVIKWYERLITEGIHLNILITGGTGFVGKNVTKSLIKKGHHVFILTRTPQHYNDSSSVTHLNYQHPVDQLPDIYAVINLAGESIFGYWTTKKKDNILRSRIQTTKKIINMVKQMKVKPSVFMNGSAIGFYGTSSDLIFTEKTTDPGNDFLADVVRQWEQTAKEVECLGIRTIYARFGVILGEEGALPLMKLPVKLFAGGKIGHGEQWLSWIHIEDVVNLLTFALTNEEIKGPLNITSPHPIRNKDFIKILAKVCKRPYWLPAPTLFMRTILGEMSELITKGQFVLPEKAMTHHFNFSYPYLQNALDNIQSWK